MDAHGGNCMNYNIDITDQQEMVLLPTVHSNVRDISLANLILFLSTNRVTNTQVNVNGAANIQVMSP